MRPVDPGEELVEVIGTEGEVMAVTTRAEMRAGRLRHRATYVAIIRSDDSVVVHRRADCKDVNAGLWDVAFGGVCSVGEDFATSARRELAEEAGITGVELVEVGRDNYDDADNSIVAVCYVARTNAEVLPADGEVAEVDEVSRADLAFWLRTHEICADSFALVVPHL